MANISVVGRIVSDDIELKISANNRPYLWFDLAERTGKGAYARTQYYQVVAFGAIASQFAKRGLCRGALISVEGTLELEDYTPIRLLHFKIKRHWAGDRNTCPMPFVYGGTAQCRSRLSFASFGENFTGRNLSFPSQ